MPAFRNILVLKGLITRQRGEVSGSPPSGIPSEITYDAVSTDPEMEITVTDKAPTRRVADGARVIVAQALDPCWIEVILNDDREVRLFVQEGVPFTEACPEP